MGFAEYFLFENKKGFVCTFANNSFTLQDVRLPVDLCGRLMVVPASAFKEKEKRNFMRRRLTEQWDMHGVKYMMRNRRVDHNGTYAGIFKKRCRSGCANKRKKTVLKATVFWVDCVVFFVAGLCLEAFLFRL